MDDNLKKRMRSHLKENEGVKDQPYRDSNGNLTVGVGINVSRKADFVALKFQTKDAKTGAMRDATDQEKAAEFDRLVKMDEQAIRDYHDRFTLPQAEIDTKLDEKITEHEAGVKSQIGEADWNKLTDGQKVAVLDVHYANPGGLDNFPKLKAAIKTGNAREMAIESDFHGGQIAGTPHQNRNFDRMRRNRAAMQGIDPESDEAYRDVADTYPAHPSLPPQYAKHKSFIMAFPPPPRPKDISGETAGQPPAKSDSPQRPERAPDSASEQSNASQAGQDALPPAPENPAGEKSGALRGEDDFSLAKVGGAVWDGITSVIGIRSAHASELPDAVRQQMKPALDQGRQETPADPRAASLIQMASAPIDNPGKAALLKPMEKLTEDEMKAMLNHAQGDYRGFRAGDPLKAHTYEKVQDWHVAMYGDAPQANDGGKPIEPQPIRPIPRQASPHTTPDGRDLWQATAKIGHQVADAAGTDGYEHAVKGLQRGLNILNQAHPLPERSPAYGPYTKLGPVIEDGQYGPQTDFALKHATARLGPAKVQDGLALGRFNTFARNVQRNGNPEGLEDKTHSLFGPLFRGAADGKAPKVEGGVLQETLNGFGQDLKVDNWIGPKTTQAFSTVLRENDADDVTRAFGRGLGFL